ncbi:3-deoxy-7-phosphoheptulonate synthase [Lentzea sp. DG1S-22]|uniref:3-deoxy-7-phosphoheptulonate synthase n=1 Tax=Lentzea sp. DG1S-22 TaxID=3108822 RepID=UPI002E767285|nr:3-deoxy-7-phosphoheptulonate synthase [Lentzea sp. DG1S-22]WVH82143.1 3-deoxy-7-phosphoheptulonate synthase [Lentzea sp. DG1S-22]
MLNESLIDAIGGTPLVRLRTGSERGVLVHAKLEMQNLFAMKDRVAKNIITRARRSGELAEGAPIVESSSGTMALGVALVGTLLGHPVHIVTDPRIDKITMAKLTGLGCAVHVVSEMDGNGWQGARLSKLDELMTTLPGAFWPRQYSNPENPAAYRALADELVAELGEVDVLVGAVGSGGSLCGTSRALRERLPDLRVVGVDCVGSVLFGQHDWPQRLQSGLGNSLHPPNLDHEVIDEVHWLNDREAFEATRALTREEKLFGGNTSGSVYRVLTWLAATALPGTRVVGILPDRGDRYSDTVHDEAYWAERGLPDLPLATTPRRVAAGAQVSSWSYRVNDSDRPPLFVFVEANTTGTGMRALGVARELGYRAVLVTNQPERYHGLADTGATVVTCDTNDEDALALAVARVSGRDPVAAVTTTSEFYLATAARLAARLGLPAADADAVERCRDKAALRSALADAGVRQPRFAVVTEATTTGEAVAVAGLPCVVKPVGESGSTNVLRCATTAEATAQAATILAVTANVRGQATRRAALVEQYLDQPEYSVEMFGTGKEQRLLGIVEKTVTPGPHFVETRHVLPAALPAPVAEEVASTVRAALAAVALEAGPSHTEVKIGPDGASVVEINPRLAGGMIPELFRLTTGVDLLDAQVRAAAGAEVELPESVEGHAGIQFLLPPEAGVLDEVTGVALVEALPGVRAVTITVQPGQQVAPPVDFRGRAGYVIATAPTRAELVETLDRAAALIGFRLRQPQARPVSAYPLVDRTARETRSTVEVGGVAIGPDTFTLVAGPCAVESPEQTIEAARLAKAAGAVLLRGGAYKPRSSPYGFRGLRADGLRILAEVRAETGMPVVTEVVDSRDVELVADWADMLQVGTRNMQNFGLLEAVGDSGKPVLLKRGMSATVEEWLLAAEYIALRGNSDIVLCERGIRTFEPSVRNTLDLSAVLLAQARSHLPVVVDPSHAAGRRELVRPLARAAVAAGADGVMIDVHPDPASALCDGPQALTASDLSGLAGQLEDWAALAGRLPRQLLDPERGAVR